jgi:hypothetical protein
VQEGEGSVVLRCLYELHRVLFRICQYDGYMWKRQLATGMASEQHPPSLFCSLCHEHILPAKAKVQMEVEVMAYVYLAGKEIYTKDRHLVELEAYQGRKFSKHCMTHSKKRK